MTLATSHRTGLTTAKAARLLREHGPNVVVTAASPGPLARVAQQLRDPLILVLLVAALLTIVTGDYTDAIIIAVVVVVNTSVGVGQELRADRAVSALSALAAPEVRVRRDGVATVIDTSAVVPGDVVLLGEGDIVPADAEVLEASALTVDESALTGESVPVSKDAARQGRAADTVAAGSTIVRGRGEAVVVATGARSATGRISALMAAPPALTPLQRRLVGLGRTLAGVGALLCLVVMAIGLVNRQPVELMAVTAISLLVAAVPESLPAVVTLALALGARRMATRQAIVRRLPAVETLGAVSVLATDKTGTLTEGRMVVEAVWTPDGDAAVAGRGYSPEGLVSVDGRQVRADGAPHLRALLEAAVLCNDASLRPPATAEGTWEPFGDPMEAALVAAAARLGLAKTAVEERLPRIGEIPFDSTRQRMTTVHRRPDGRCQVVCKGAPEVIFTRVAAEPTVLSAARAQAASYAARGYRVLAIATAVRPAEPAELEHLEDGLSLTGLVALVDPPRLDAAATIDMCRAAGISPVLVTGDHPETAAAIARRLRILDKGGTVALGDDLADGDVDVTAVRVLARTRPEQKVAVVEALQRAGRVVAMAGDGVNDGPALRRADIGVAMGRGGTEVARQAADLVLADDDLGTVVAAVEEGRRIYDNVRRFLLYGLAGGTAEILIMLAGPVFGLAVPLLPAQILWINLVTHGISGVALGAEPAEPDVLRRPPRPAKQHVLGDGLAGQILVLGAFVTSASLAVGLAARAWGLPWQTMLFLALATTQLAVALGVRARTSAGHTFLFTAVVCAFAVQLAGVYLPGMTDLLGTQPLGPGEATGVVVVSGLGGFVARLVTRTRAARSLAGAGAVTPPSAAGYG